MLQAQLDLSQTGAPRPKTQTELLGSGPLPSKVTGRLADPDFLVSIVKKNLDIASTGASVHQSIQFDPNTPVIYILCGLSHQEQWCCEKGVAPKIEIRVRNVPGNDFILDEVEPIALKTMETILGRSLDQIKEQYNWLETEQPFKVGRNSSGDTLHISVNTLVWKGIKEAGL
jgi:hypothetical protein